ncbi:glycosyltransferase family 4 protein [Neobacillus sp. C211]|uniref:glycosyltransferase family 4 protein n=1 Tax=unclassified Neobacillus TaxID=2675272 RepID=UPI00397B2DD0
MKILLVSYYPLPALGGIWRFVSQLKNRLEHLGHTVDVLSHNPEATKYRIIGRQPEVEISQLSPYIKEKLTEAFPILHSNYWIYHTELYRYSLELSSLYYGLHQYDIIHAQDVIAARAISRVKPKHIPLVTSAHGNLSGAIFYHLKTGNRYLTDNQIKDRFEYEYHKALEYSGYHCSDYIHTQSNWMREKIINEFSISADKLFTFPYGMDIEGYFKRSEVETSISRPPNKKVILFTGRLVYLKGLQHLIESLAILKLYRSDWECWILGEGLLQNELQAQCINMGLEGDVKFLGVSDNVPHFLRQADIFVLPGLQDTQPHSVMEAQLSGVPVIVSDAAGLPEMVINGENGLVAAAGNSHQLYLHLNYLLDNPDIRTQFANSAKEWAKDRWSIDKMVNNFVALYKHAISSSN